MSNPRVSIGCFRGAFDGFARYPVSVAVDVIRATTTAVTGVALGRRCFPVSCLDEAVKLAAEFDDPLLVGELGGSTPYGFSLTNSPADLAMRADIDRPMILLSTSGTRLIAAAPQSIYVACLRNYSALIHRLVSLSADVALIGAGTRGEFREEDALCCARIAAGLLDSGFQAGDETTASIVERWTDQPVDAFVGGKSTEYLRASGQLRDLEFILTHIDDLDDVFVKVGREILLDENDHLA
jgi:2-phosphosulfolactate phosphatase